MKYANPIGRLACFVFFALLMVVIHGCAITGEQLTTGGEAFEPHMIWAGDRFGIVYYHAPKKGGPVQINVVTLDDNGKIIKHVKAIDQKIGAPAISPHALFRLSDLVWNNEVDSEKKQLAFAYTFDNGNNYGHGIMLVILDANLVVKVHKPVVFPAGSGQWAELFSPSLVWNSQKREYAIAFTHQDYLSNKPVSKNSLRLAIYDGTGKKIHPGIGHNLLICPDHCDVASLTADSNTGAYAVAYYASSMGANIMFFDVNAGLINKTGNHLLQKGTQTKNLNVRYNIHDNNYFYTDNIYGSELGISIIQKNGKITKSYSKGKGYDLCFSVTPFGWAYNSHIISATDNHDDRVHCWNVMVGNSGVKDGHQKDLAWTPKGSKHPSVATVNKVLPYLSWIQNGTLRFSCLVKKQGLP